MTKTDMSGKKIEELKELALSWNVALPEGAKKKDIVDLLMAEQEKRQGGLELGNLEMGSTDGKTDPSIDDILAGAAKSVKHVNDDPSDPIGDKSKEVVSGEDKSAAGVDEVKAFEDAYINNKPNPHIADLSAIPITMIPVAELTPSNMNFFKKLSDSKYSELKESIVNNGLLNPVIVRTNKEGADSTKSFEILAGENRFHIFSELGKLEIPARIVDVSDDKAKEILVDTNVAQRQELTAMEIAKAYDEKKRILGNRQGKRTDLTGDDQSGATRDLIAQEYGKSGMTVDRYLRLMNLTPKFQELVDSGEIPAKTGMELGLLDEETQNKIFATNKSGAEGITTKNVSAVKTLINEKKKQELEKESNKGKKKDEIAVNVTKDELNKIFNTVQESDKKGLKIVINVPVDFDADTIEFIDGNEQDGMFFLEIIRKYAKGELVPAKGAKGVSA